MRLKKVISLAAVASLMILFACNNPFPGFDKTKSGLYYNFHEKNDCDEPAKPGDLISFNMRVYTKDSVFAESSPVYEKQKMDSSIYAGDLYEAMGMMCAGDSATFIFVADSLKKYYGLVFDLEDGAFIHIDIGMKRVMTPEMVAAEEDSLIDAELSRFEVYKKENAEGFEELLPGVLFKETVKGSGMKVNDTAILSIRISGATLDGVVFLQEDEDEIDFIISDDNQIPFNWNAALLNMREGGEATIVLTSPNAFGRRGFGQGMVGQFQTVILDVKIVKVSPGMKDFEKYSLSKFIKLNEIKEKPTASGLYHIVQEEGTGPKLKSKDKVMVHYVGFYLDMGVFDSSRQRGEPMEIIIDESELIKGWHEALKMMRVGEKARIILPSSLAYGAAGSPPAIRPYSPLIFDLEVVEKL